MQTSELSLSELLSLLSFARFFFSGFSGRADVWLRICPSPPPGPHQVPRPFPRVPLDSHQTTIVTPQQLPMLTHVALAKY